MRSKFLYSFAIPTALCVMLGNNLAAADAKRPSSGVAHSVDENGIKESNELDMPGDADHSSAKPSAPASSPAKQKVMTKPAPIDSGRADSNVPPTVKRSPKLSAAEEKAKPAPRGTELKPVVRPASPAADRSEAPPVSVETAIFKGVVPGVSTRVDVERIWGKPKSSTQADGMLVQRYAVEPFQRVDVSYADGKVSSIVIHFARSFPADVVAKQLDLVAIRPVQVSNDLGEVLGQAYPERGVLFTFEPSDATGKSTMKVPQVILEPVSAEPFVLRAEMAVESRPDLSRRDAEQALRLEPDMARAHWLLSRLRAANEQHEEALAAAREAMRLDDNPQYRVTYAQILAQVGRLSEAAEEAKKASQASGNRSHVKARAVCLLGNLLASGPKPDFKKALEMHSQAIQLADPLRNDQHPAIRVAAKEVLADAYLGAAHDIAWGQWKEKAKAVSRWLERAAEATDDLVINENASRQVLFRLHARSLAVYVGLRGEVDPEPAAKAVLAAGEKLVAAAVEPGRKAQLEWELGMALYDAVQICQMRSDNDAALKHGEEAVKCLAEASQMRPSSAASLLLGRAYFRLGAIHAISRHDHQAAVASFDKAVPLFDRLTPDDVTGSLSRHGESLVTMGVSYWEIGRQQEAVSLSESGIKWMEKAVEQGVLDRSALAIPYANLAAMHRKLGADDQADRYQGLASRAKKENSR
ncbi:MAG: hypothetical protein ABFC63_00470 [Thermoguttaceae bacterium]